jgi:hypothetical protein
MTDNSPSQSPKSGLYYPNMFVRIYFDALQHIVGEQEFSTILSLAGLDRYIGNIPPRSLDREFDFADFSSLNAALETKYGVAAGRDLALKVGRGSLPDGLRYMGALVGVGDLAFKNLPISVKLRWGLWSLETLFTRYSDQITVLYEHNNHLEYIIKQCPVCWGRSSDVSFCHSAVGLIQEGLRWVSQGQEFRVEETECHAKGDQYCLIKIYKTRIA